LEFKLTPKRLAWLRQLAESGPADRHSSVGFFCMQAGLTEWNWVLKETGEPIAMDEAKARFGMPECWERVRAEGERLTEAGHAVVREHSHE
jgi:hypothetical protein